MGKRGHRRSASQDEDNVGCVWGLMRMLYFRRDPKFLLDTKQFGGSHTFRETNEWEHSTKSSSDFDEIQENGNIEESTSQKPTVKNLMEDELGKLELLRKKTNYEVERKLADLGNDVSVDGRSKHTNKAVENSCHDTEISAPLSPSVDSVALNHAEEYDLEAVLGNFLGEIYSCHSECSHGDCKNNNDLCPSLKSLIHTKVNDLNNLPSNTDHVQSQESSDGNLLDQNSLSKTMAVQSKQFKDALEILSSNKELFLKLLQKPNPHIVGNIEKHQKSKVTTGLEPKKILGQTNFVGGRRGSNQHRLATEEQAKESKFMFFWRREKSNRRQRPEPTNGTQTVSKIVILKPNSEKRIDQNTSTSAKSLHQQPCTSHAPERTGRETSRFSIKEVKRRFRIATDDSRTERNVAPAEDLKRDPRKLKDSVIAIKKDLRHLPEGSLADKSASRLKSDIRPLISSKQKQQNACISEISGRTVAQKEASIFYEEAKRHLSEMLNENNRSDNYPTVEDSESLEGILSLPHCNLSTPRSSPSKKDCLESSPEGRSQSQDDLGSIACCTSALVDDQVKFQEGYCMIEAQEGPRNVTDDQDIMCIEGIDKLDCGERISNTQCIPAERCRDDAHQEMLEETKQGKEHVMFLDSLESIGGKMETPEPRAPTKFISRGSPEHSNEKQENPSPISVLELVYEDIDSPDCINRKECELHEGLNRTLYFPDNDSDVNVLWEDKNARLEIIKLVLELSELCAEENLEVWYLEDELISPCLFEELQDQGYQTDDLKILFDCICEALTEIQERYFRLSSWISFLKHDIRMPPIGENLVTEVDRYVDRYIQYNFPSALEKKLKRDLEVQIWMDIRSKTEEIITEIWDFVLDELIDEAVFELWISD